MLLRRCSPYVCYLHPPPLGPEQTPELKKAREMSHMMFDKHGHGAPTASLATAHTVRQSTRTRQVTPRLGHCDSWGVVATKGWQANLAAATDFRPSSSLMGKQHEGPADAAPELAASPSQPELATSPPQPQLASDELPRPNSSLMGKQHEGPADAAPELAASPSQPELATSPPQPQLASDELSPVTEDDEGGPDILRSLLAVAMRKERENDEMRHRVNADMERVMDTGVRPNSSLIGLRTRVQLSSVAQPSSSAQLSYVYTVGTLVWAKIFGFPWWPSQVRLIPAHARPKASTIQAR